MLAGWVASSEGGDSWALRPEEPCIGQLRESDNENGERIVGGHMALIMSSGQRLQMSAQESISP